MGECKATMESRDSPGHIHICIGNHEATKSHKCNDSSCAKQFWKKGELA